MDLSVQELEAAINDWRERQPARGGELALGPEVTLLATVYALMIFRRQSSIAIASLDPAVQQLLQAWRSNRTT
jgi:peroxiredoxin family protein